MARIPPAALPDDLPVHDELVAALHTTPDLFRGFGSLAGRVHSASHLSERTQFLSLDLSVLAGFSGLAARVVLALDIGPGSVRARRRATGVSATTR